MGREEYEENSEYFDKLSQGDVVVAVSAEQGFKANPGSRVLNSNSYQNQYDSGDFFSYI